jgi:hypothetical protein
MVQAGASEHGPTQIRLLNSDDRHDLIGFYAIRLSNALKNLLRLGGAYKSERGQSDGAQLWEMIAENIPRLLEK